MTEPHSGERSLTSPCGNVTVRIDPGSPPKVELASGAERMFARDLADLITATAHDLVDKAVAEAETPADGPTLGGAVAALSGLRDELGEHGLMPTIERRRAELRKPEDTDPADQMRFEGTPAIALSEAAMRELDRSIELLKRLEGDPLSPSGKAGEDAPVGRATSESRLVVVESTMEYPIASVWLSKRACEIGPKALGDEVTGTAGAAAEDFARKQSEFLAGIGLPIGSADIAGVVSELGDMGRSATSDVETIEHRRQDITRRFYEGGYLA